VAPPRPAQNAFRLGPRLASRLGASGEGGPVPGGQRWPRSGAGQCAAGISRRRRC